MSKEITEEQNLAICNLVSRGVKLADAKKQVLEAAEKSAAPAADSKDKKKFSAGEKKVILGAQIRELGGEVPAESASVAKFEQALAAAQEVAKAEGDTAEGDTAEGDTAEGDTADAGDLM